MLGGGGGGDQYYSYKIDLQISCVTYRLKELKFFFSRQLIVLLSSTHRSRDWSNDGKVAVGAIVRNSRVILG